VRYECVLKDATAVRSVSMLLCVCVCVCVLRQQWYAVHRSNDSRLFTSEPVRVNVEHLARARGVLFTIARASLRIYLRRTLDETFFVTLAGPFVRREFEFRRPLTNFRRLCDLDVLCL